MMKNKTQKIISFLTAILLLFCASCGRQEQVEQGGKVDDQGGNSQISIPLEENFSFGSAIKDSENWLSFSANSSVVDSQNAFITFRENSNNVMTYGKKGMSKGNVELKLKVKINSDTMAYISFNNQSSILSNFCYNPGSKMYTVELSSDSNMYVKKWIDGQETILSGVKAKASVPLTLTTNLTNIKVSIEELENSVSIAVFAGKDKILDVQDDNNAILGGGAVGVAYTGLGGMIVGGENSDLSNYVEPEELGIPIYNQPNVAIASENVNLLANFNDNWIGRERIFSKTIQDDKVTFESKDNPEEPQSGVTEYQGLYKDKIFNDVELNYSFNVMSHGEWIMFWLRCVPETSTNVSIWGNKSSGENSNGYSVLITSDGFVQIHKWNGTTQIWLNGQGAKLPGNIISQLSNSNSIINLSASISQVELAGENIVEIRVRVNDSAQIVIQDTDSPYLNAGYVGLQGYAINNGISSIKLLQATANVK